MQGETTGHGLRGTGALAPQRELEIVECQTDDAREMPLTGSAVSTDRELSENEFTARVYPTIIKWKATPRATSRELLVDDLSDILPFCQPMPADLYARIMELTRDVVVDLDEPIEDDIEL
jgi:hypothetical protein